MSYFTPQQKKVIFFDLNRTLTDHKRSYQRCFIEVLEELAGRWEREGVDWQPEVIAAQYVKAMKKNRQRQTKRKPSLQRLRLLSMRTVLKPYPITVNEQFVRQFFRRMSQLRPQYYELHPQATTVLDKLQKSYQLGIISNHRRIELETLGLSSYFSNEHFITPQQRGKGKPHSAIYRQALQAFDAKPSECVMIGDCWTRDILGATRAGLDAIWIKRRSTRIITQRRIGKRRLLIIRNLGQLLDVF